MRGMVLGAVCALALTVSWPASADDSSAALGAGGIVLTKSADIRMASEDLTLSPKAVKVVYSFINDSGHDIDTIVAFPLPDVDNAEYAETPIGTTAGGGPDFVGFKLKVDGKSVAATADEHAIFNGKDVTAEIRAAGLPLNIVIGGYEKLQKLPAPAAARLVKLGLIENEGDAQNPNWHALWKTTTRFWWRMHFPAGKPVTVEHTYQPVTGQAFFTDLNLTEKEYRDILTKTYCMDAPTEAAIKARLALLKTMVAQKKLLTDMLEQYTTDFVIVTANNWKAPIGRFHLTIDKLKPDNIVSLCWNGLKKTGATTFESTLTNFAPKADIRLLVLENPRPDQQ